MNPKDIAQFSAEEAIKNLQLSQIELEKQNSELRKRCAELECSNAQLRDCYDMSPVAYLTLDRYGLIQGANHTASLLLGVERDALLHTELTQYVAIGAKDNWLQQLPVIFSEPGSSTLDMSFTHMDGETFSAHLQCLHLKGPQACSCLRIAFSANTYVESMAQSLVQFRQKADEKRLSLQTILDHAPIGIWMLGADEKIKFINRTFCNAVGITEQQFKEAGHYSDLLPKSVSVNCMQSDRECFTQKGLHFSRETLPFADGKGHLLEITKANIYDQQGQLLGLIGLAADITERDQMERGLKKTQAELRELAAKVELWREEERKRIAREVHDELGQVLTAIRMDVTWLDMKFSKQNIELQTKTQAMNTLLDRAGRSVRNIVSNLRPMALDVGLVSALDWLCKDFSQRTSGAYVLDAKDDCAALDEQSVVALFRIAQELLTNATRHSGASEVSVVLHSYNDELYLSVSDNGAGFDYVEHGAYTSFGLLGIRERVLALGGTVEFVTAPQQGTHVNVAVPVKGEK